VRIEHSKKFRKLVPARCRFCDRRFFYQPAGRSRLFCDDKCRQADFRHARYLDPKRNERCQKTEVNSKISKVDFGDRPPVEILGCGHHWNVAASIDRETWKAIVEIEIDRVNIGEPDTPVVASQWKPCVPSSPITDDLSIPVFLRRGRL
jgi:hypothetical protein